MRMHKWVNKLSEFHDGCHTVRCLLVKEFEKGKWTPVLMNRKSVEIVI
jgi:hypothetical protein